MENRRELVVVIPASNDAREGNTRHRCERGNSVPLCQFEVRTLSGHVERESGRETEKDRETEKERESNTVIERGWKRAGRSEVVRLQRWEKNERREKERDEQAAR